MNIVSFPLNRRQCRVCTISNLEGLTDHDGAPSAWADDDLCSDCADGLAEAEKRDAARYRYLRNRGLTNADIANGGVFAGTVPANLILGGESLDRAVDAAMGETVETLPTLESRLAKCLAEAVDTPLLSGREAGNPSPVELRLGFFMPELAERAAALLEEAGE